MNCARLLLAIVAIAGLSACARQADAPSPNLQSVENAIKQRALGCGSVLETELMANHSGTDFYFVRCSDESEYVYALDDTTQQYGIMTCDDAQSRGLYCPSYFRPKFGLPAKSRMSAPDPKVIELTLKQRALSCSRVVETRLIGNQVATDFYFVRCGDGAKYVYIHDYPTGSYSVTTCEDVATRGVSCPS